MIHNVIIALMTFLEIIDFHLEMMSISASEDNFESYYNTVYGKELRIISYITCWVLMLLCGVKAFTTGHLL
jgi:hypothetical protein